MQATPATAGDEKSVPIGKGGSSRPSSHKPTDGDRRVSTLGPDAPTDPGQDDQAHGDEEQADAEPRQETIADWYQKLNLELEDVEYDPVEEFEGIQTLQCIKNNLSKPGQKFAFLALNVPKQNLTNLYNFLSRYPHVREVDISQNRIPEISSVTYMPHLVSLKASSNLLTSIDFMAKESVLEFLTNAEFSKNQIKSMPALAVKRLRFLDLKENLITSCEQLNGHPTLEKLELRKNKLKSTAGLANMPQLTELYLAQNELVDLSGLENLPKLKKLHLRENKQLEKFGDIKVLPSLSYLNLRDSGFKEREDVQKLIPFAGLRKVSVTGTPFEAEVGDVKTELLMFLQQLTHLAKDTEEIPAEDKAAALETLKSRLQELEEKRREEEQRRLEEMEQQQAKDNPQDGGVDQNDD